MLEFVAFEALNLERLQITFTSTSMASFRKHFRQCMQSDVISSECTMQNLKALSVLTYSRSFNWFTLKWHQQTDSSVCIDVRCIFYYFTKINPQPSHVQSARSQMKIAKNSFTTVEEELFLFQRFLIKKTMRSSSFSFTLFSRLRSEEFQR